MKKFIKERHLIPFGVWFVVYMALFLHLEVYEPESVHLIFCGLDHKIPYIPAFVYPYLSWFPYICVCAWLAVRNLEDQDYKKAVFILTAGMNVFLLISYVWPTGLDLREGIVYDTAALSGYLMQLVQTVDAPKSVFPSMHVYVTLVLQYTLELQKNRLSMKGIWTGRFFAAAIILSTMFTKQHSVLDVLGAFLLFGLLAAGYGCYSHTGVSPGRLPRTDIPSRRAIRTPPTAWVPPHRQSRLRLEATRTPPTAWAPPHCIGRNGTKARKDRA